MYESSCRAGWQSEHSGLKGVSERHWEMHFWEFSSTSRTWLKHFKGKEQLCLWATPRGGSCVLRRVQNTELYPKPANNYDLMTDGPWATTLWPSFSGEKAAGCASPGSWCVWCLVNVGTWWGVTGTGWAVQSLTAKYFKAKILIYCSLEVKQLLNIWFWYQAWLCRDFFRKNSCVNWSYII